MLTEHNPISTTKKYFLFGVSWILSCSFKTVQEIEEIEYAHELNAECYLNIFLMFKMFFIPDHHQYFIVLSKPAPPLA